MTIPDAPRECGVPTPPCSAFHLLSSPAHSTRLAIRSGQFSQVQPQPARQRLNSSFPRAIRPPDRCGRFRAVRDSPSDVVACQRVVRIHTRSPVTRRPTTRATHARAAPGVHVGQLAPKTSSKASHEARNWREECEVLDAGSRGGPQFVMPCHATSYFGDFGRPFPR